MARRATTLAHVLQQSIVAEEIYDCLRNATRAIACIYAEAALLHISNIAKFLQREVNKNIIMLDLQYIFFA